MAATTLAKDVLYRVSEQLNDLNPQFKRWSEKSLVAWLNDGQRVIAKFLPPACSRVDAIKLRAGTRQSIDTVASNDIINGDGSTAAAVKGRMILDITRNMGSDGATPGRAINVVGGVELSNNDPSWHASSGSEVSEYVYDIRTPKNFYVYPGATASPAVWVEVAWLVNPVDVPYSSGSMVVDGSSTTVISIDDQFVDELFNYIMARAQLKDSNEAGNAALASAYAGMFISSINALATQYTGNNPNLQVLPLTPAIPAAAR